ncbi:hypothetical protein QR685DRAFT_436708, partial [Neurospora intermedia]
LRKREDFILEEDGHSGYRIGGNNNCYRGNKERNGFEYYFNCSSSPNFPSIEKAWQSPKQYLWKRGK